LIDFTPELRAEAIKVASRYKMGPIFTPPVVSKLDGPLGTLVFGCCQGGTGWPGGSYDPGVGGWMALGWSVYRPDWAAAQLNAWFIVQGDPYKIASRILQTVATVPIK
jgi:hypothetical protein